MKLLAAIAALVVASTLFAITATGPSRADRLATAAEGPAGDRNDDDRTDDAGRAPCVPMGRDDTILVDVRGAPLGDLARLVSCATERNILFSPSELAQRQVTIVSARPIGRRALIALWHTLLAENGLAGERRGAYEVIRPSPP